MSLLLILSISEDVQELTSSAFSLLFLLLANLPAGREKIEEKTIVGKNAGPAGCVLMVDANRSSSSFLLFPLFGGSKLTGNYLFHLSEVWDVAQAVEYVKQLKPLNPW